MLRFEAIGGQGFEMMVLVQICQVRMVAAKVPYLNRMGTSRSMSFPVRQQTLSRGARMLTCCMRELHLVMLHLARQQRMLLYFLQVLTACLSIMLALRLSLRLA